MDNAVKFENIVPTNLLIDPPVSSAHAIDNKVIVDVYPNDQSEYSFDGNDKIVINLSSMESFFNGADSIFYSDISIDPLVNTDNIEIIPESLVHLFKRLTLFDENSNIILERLEYPAFKDFLDLVLCQRQSNPAESVSNFRYKESIDDTLLVPIPYNVVFDNNDLTVTINDGLASSRMKFTVGDILVFEGMEFEVEGIDVTVGNTVLTLINSPPFTHTAPGYSVSVRSGGRRANTSLTGIRFLDTEEDEHTNEGGYRLKMRFPFQLFKHQLPLYLMGSGIRIELELQKTSLVNGSPNPTLNYVADSDVIPPILFKNNVYRCSFVEPSKDIRRKFRHAFETQGLLYYFRGYIVKRVTGFASEGSTFLQTSIGVRSARTVIAACIDSSQLDGDTQTVLRNRPYGNFSANNITTFQFQVGSSRYPTNLVQAADVDGYLTTIFPNYYMDQRDAYYPYETRIGTTVVIRIDKRNFIMAADLSRDPKASGLLTGTDLSSLPLELNIQRNGTYSDYGHKGIPVYMILVSYDAFFKIDTDGMTILN